MNLEDNKNDELLFLTPADKWIISKVNTLAKEVTDNMSNYELGLAVDKIHSFLWDEYCDWYIEMAKPRLYGEDEDVKSATISVLVYVLENTLTDHGTVSRAICERDENGFLQKIVECPKIAKDDDRAKLTNDDGKTWEPIAKGSVVSMNFWGFTPKIFEQCEPIFEEFIRKGVVENPMKCEHVIPTAIGTLLEQKACTVKVLTSNDRWFGVTYKEDKPYVVQCLKDYKDQGLYPFDLWK